jgi:hypothetical protein
MEIGRRKRGGWRGTFEASVEPDIVCQVFDHTIKCKVVSQEERILREEEVRMVDTWYSCTSSVDHFFCEDVIM